MGVLGLDTSSYAEVINPQHPVECVGRAKRRRRFRMVLARPNMHVVMKSRFAHTVPKWCGVSLPTELHIAASIIESIRILFYITDIAFL